MKRAPKKPSSLSKLFSLSPAEEERIKLNNLSKQKQRQEQPSAKAFNQNYSLPSSSLSSLSLEETFRSREGGLLSPIRKPQPQPQPRLQPQPEPQRYTLFEGESSGSSSKSAELDAAERLYNERVVRIARVLFDTDYPSEPMKHIAYRIMEVVDNYKNGSLTAARAAIVALDMAMYDGPASLGRANNQTEFSSYFSVDSVFEILQQMENRPAGLGSSYSPLSGRSDVDGTTSLLSKIGSYDSSPMESLSPLPRFDNEEEEQEQEQSPSDELVQDTAIPFGFEFQEKPQTPETQKGYGSFDDSNGTDATGNDADEENGGSDSDSDSSEDAVFHDSFEQFLDDDENSGVPPPSPGEQQFDGDSVEVTDINDLVASPPPPQTPLPADPLISHEQKKIIVEEEQKSSSNYFLWQDFYGLHDRRNSLYETEDPLAMGLSQLLRDSDSGGTRLTEHDGLTKQRLLSASMIYCIQSVHLDPDNLNETGLNRVLEPAITFADGVLMPGTGIDVKPATAEEHQVNLSRDVNIAVISLVDFAGLELSEGNFMMAEAKKNFAELRRIHPQREESGIALHYYHFLIRYKSSRTSQALEFYFEPEDTAIMEIERDRLLFDTVEYATYLQQQKQSPEVLDAAIERQVIEEEVSEEVEEAERIIDEDKEAKEADAAFGVGENQEEEEEDEDEDEEEGLELVILIDPINTGGLSKQQLAKQRQALQAKVYNIIEESEVIDKSEYTFANSNLKDLAHTLTDVKHGGVLFVMTPVYVKGDNFMQARSATLDLLVSDKDVSAVIDRKDLSIYMVYFVEQFAAARYASNPEGYVYVDNEGGMAIPTGQLIVPYVVPGDLAPALTDMLRPMANIVEFGPKNKLAEMLPIFIGIVKGSVTPQSLFTYMQNNYIAIEHDGTAQYGDAGFYERVFGQDAVRIRRPFPRQPLSPLSKEEQVVSKQTPREQQLIDASKKAIIRDINGIRATIAREFDAEFAAKAEASFAPMMEIVEKPGLTDSMTYQEFHDWATKAKAQRDMIRKLMKEQMDAKKRQQRQQKKRSTPVAAATVAGAELNAYELLGIDRSKLPANAAEADRLVKKRYHAAARANHPDKNAEGNKLVSDELFKQINEAYHQIETSDLRAAYDLSLNLDGRPAPNSIFGSEQEVQAALRRRDQVKQMAAMFAEIDRLERQMQADAVETRQWLEKMNEQMRQDSKNASANIERLVKEKMAPIRAEFGLPPQPSLQQLMQQQQVQQQQQQPLNYGSGLKLAKQMEQQQEQRYAQKQAEIEHELVVRLRKLANDCEEMLRVAAGRLGRTETNAAKLLEVYREQLFTLTQQLDYFETRFSSPVQAQRAMKSLQDLQELLQQMVPADFVTSRKMQKAPISSSSTSTSSLSSLISSSSSNTSSVKSRKKGTSSLYRALEGGSGSSSGGAGQKPFGADSSDSSSSSSSSSSSPLSFASLFTSQQKKLEPAPVPKPKPKPQTLPRLQQQQQPVLPQSSDLASSMAQLKQTANLLTPHSNSEQFSQAKRQAEAAKTLVMQQYTDASNLGAGSVGSSNIRINIVLVGSLNVGKTTFAFMLKTKKPVPGGQGTEGADSSAITQIKTTMASYDVQLVDTNGEERYMTTSNSNYIGATAAIIMVDLTNPATFLELANVWSKEVLSKIPENVRTVMVFANKLDDEDVDQATTQELNRIVKSLPPGSVDLVKAGSAYKLKDVQEAVAAVCRANATKRGLLASSAASPAVKQSPARPAAVPSPAPIPTSSSSSSSSGGGGGAMTLADLFAQRSAANTNAGSSSSSSSVGDSSLGRKKKKSAAMSKLF